MKSILLVVCYILETQQPYKVFLVYIYQVLQIISKQIYYKLSENKKENHEITTS